ncbi:hypothetical protein XELAEV_18002016mg [Xenopus laevis]|uniref:Uncharacterized protein n=1 Tax=Xenopus laevis TaxID=8355 RepID=A0A974BNV0_XENLA|nr:hypothetical protein XELAEV_18002016mg [Xenopus laevis]
MSRKAADLPVKFVKRKINCFHFNPLPKQAIDIHRAAVPHLHSNSSHCINAILWILNDIFICSCFHSRLENKVSLLSQKAVLNTGP